MLVGTKYLQDRIGLPVPCAAHALRQCVFRRSATVLLRCRSSALGRPDGTPDLRRGCGSASPAHRGRTAGSVWRAERVSDPVGRVATMSNRKKLKPRKPETTSPRARPATVWDESPCPVCGQPIEEIGGVGCCGAITADCVGTVDGVSAREFDFEADEAAWDRVVRHAWYVDTRLPAPMDWDLRAVPCRCSVTR